MWLNARGKFALYRFMEETIAKAKKVIEIEVEAIRLLADKLDEQFVGAVMTLKEVLDRGKKIVIVGVGKSGNIGHKIAATLNSTGA